MAYVVIRDLDDCRPCPLTCSMHAAPDRKACGRKLQLAPDTIYICTLVRGHSILLAHQACAEIEGECYHAIAEWAPFDYAEAC